MTKNREIARITGCADLPHPQRPSELGSATVISRVDSVVLSVRDDAVVLTVWEATVLSEALRDAAHRVARGEAPDPGDEE